MSPLNWGISLTDQFKRSKVTEVSLTGQWQT
ncbi:hypothetical protein EMIT091MI3_30025 [Kosakonia quasisacchari]